MKKTREPMKLIFLDIDGVLNNAASFFLNGLLEDGHDVPFGEQWKYFDITCAGLLDKLCRVSGAKVVMSTSWRKRVSIAEFNEVFLGQYKLTNVEIVGLTPVSDRGFRGEDVNQYLKALPLPPAQYVILDDHEDFYTEQKVFRLVQTNSEYGLCLDDISRAMRILDVDKLVLAQTVAFIELFKDCISRSLKTAA